MTDPRVPILGHSFVHRLHSFIVSSSNLTLSLGIAEPIVVKWHGIGGRTIAKVLAHDLRVVESFQPHLVILELGTNDLSHLDPTTVGSSLEDLAQVLHSRYRVQRVVVCQTLFRDKAMEFNTTGPFDDDDDGHEEICHEPPSAIFETLICDEFS